MLRPFCCLIILLLFPAILLSENKLAKEVPTKKLFLKIKKIWMVGNARDLKKLLAKKVSLNLGKQKGRFSKEQATAILKTYFQKIKVVQFKYYAKKMKLKKASAIYCYKSKSSGKPKQQIIYISVLKNKTSKKWLIYSIRIIG